MLKRSSKKETQSYGTDSKIIMNNNINTNKFIIIIIIIIIIGLILISKHLSNDGGQGKAN